MQVAQLQADVGYYQGQADTALQESDGLQQTVGKLRSELADKAERASQVDDMQAEVQECLTTAHVADAVSVSAAQEWCSLVQIYKPPQLLAQSMQPSCAPIVTSLMGFVDR